MAQNCENHTVDTDGGLYYVRSVGPVLFGVVVLDLLAGELLVVAEVEVGTAVDTLKLLEAEGEVELDVGSGIGVVGQLLVVVETVVLRAHSEVDMPLHSLLFPLCKPLQLGSGLDEELHLHLLELPHAEYELAGDDLVAEGLADLGDTERNLHSAGLLDVEVVDEDALGGLRTQVDGVGGVGGAAHRSLEHKVELADVCPVAGTADRAHDAAVDDDVLVLGEVVSVLRCHIAIVDFVVLCLLTQHVGIGCAELCLVEALAELAAAFLHLLVYLFLDLGEIVLDKDVGSIPLLGVFIVNQRVVEGTYVAGCLPDPGVHEDARVDTDYVLVEAGHGVPPVLFDVVLEFGTHLAVVVDGCETVVDLARRENETVLLAVRDKHFENFFLSHIVFCSLISKGYKFSKFPSNISASGPITNALSFIRGCGTFRTGVSTRSSPTSSTSISISLDR